MVVSESECRKCGIMCMRRKGIKSMKETFYLDGIRMERVEDYMSPVCVINEQF